MINNQRSLVDLDLYSNKVLDEIARMDFVVFEPAKVAAACPNQPLVSVEIRCLSILTIWADRVAERNSPAIVTLKRDINWHIIEKICKNCTPSKIQFLNFLTPVFQIVAYSNFLKTPGGIEKSTFSFLLLLVQ